MQIVYDQNRDYFSERRVFLSLPKARNLKILSLGFDHFVSDLLYIWAIQFYSSYQIKNRFDYIEHIFNLITDLNPGYRDVYHIGSIIMAKEKGDVEMAIRLLLKGARNLPDEYFFYFDAGFYALWDLQQYERARNLFQKALEVPSIPKKRRLLLKNMIAHTLFYANDLRASFNAWLNIYRSEDSLPHQRNVARTRLYTIKADLDIGTIREAIRRYLEKNRRLPDTLGTLVAEGYLSEVPRDFFGYEYLYDPRSGKVEARKAFKIYRRQ
jgi:tetratricopeptide (TPR) repeat protein